MRNHAEKPMRSSCARIKAGVFCMLFLVVLAPTTVLASDLSPLINKLPASIKSTLPQAFLNNPTTQNLGTLSPLAIKAILNNIPKDAVPSLPQDTLSSIPPSTLPSIISGVSGIILKTFPTGVFSSLPQSTLTTVLSGVPSGVLSSFPQGILSNSSPSTITSILSSLPTSILSGLPSVLTSGLSSPAVTSILSSFGANGTLGSLPSTLLSGQTSSIISSALSTLPSGILSSIPSTLTSSLSVPAVTSILSSFGANGTLGSLPSTLLSGQASAALSSIIQSPALSGVVSSFTPALFSSVPSSVMGGLTSGATSLLPSSVTAAIPGIGGGGIFVPVKDSALNSAFSAYAGRVTSALTDSSDSLRDIIAGANPGGVAKGDCVKSPYSSDFNYALSPYQAPPGPWQEAIASSPGYGYSADSLPSNIDVQVNSSGSLRCILQDLIGYQKISLFVQIQSMLKQYIADAQQQQLTNKLLDEISATNLNWAKEGERVEAGGVLTTEPVYVLNASQSQNARNARTLDALVAESAAGNLCNPLQTASAVAINTRSKTEDPRNFITESTRCSLSATDGGPFTGSDPNGAFASYMRDANTPRGLGALYTLEHMINNPQDTPIGAAFIVQSEAERRIAEDEKRYAEDRANSGFQPTYKCSGRPDDPNCDPALMISVSPAAQNQAIVTGAVQSGNEEIARANTLDSNPGDAAQTLSTNASTEGVYGYDSTRLGSTNPPVNALIHELYDTIGNAYFDLSKDQTKWSQAALLLIYDEMNFNPNKPATELPRNETDITY